MISKKGYPLSDTEIIPNKGNINLDENKEKTN